MQKAGTTLIRIIGENCPVGLNGVSRIPPKIKSLFANPYAVEAMPDYFFKQDIVKTLPEMLKNKSPQQIRRFLDKFGGNEKILQNVTNRWSRIFGTSKGFSDAEMQVLYRKAFPNIKIPSGLNEDAFIYLNRLSGEAGSKFDAHGLAKVSVSEQLKQLNNLLSKGIDKDKNFYTAPLAVKADAHGVGAGLGTSGGHAYRDGSFIVVSGKGKFLGKDGIEHVIVNDAYYNIIGDLQKKFPGVNFVKADKAAEYFNKLGA